jgi:hypothetical protein
MTVKDAARQLFQVDEPDTRQTEKARRRLEKLITEGNARKEPAEPGKPGKAETTYYVQGLLA